MRVTIPTKVRSQRGATFSMALLLLLVCTIVSSIVLAAATSMTGVVAQQGKSDQRYYSVTSAVGALTSWASGEDIIFKSVQTRNSSGATVTTTKNAPVATGDAFDDLFLVATDFVLFGVGSDATAEQQLEGMSRDVWIEPFDNGAWNNLGGHKSALQLSTNITPTLSSSGNTIGSGSRVFDLTVLIEGKLCDDGVLLLVFKDANGGGSTEQYSMLVTLHANVESHPRISANNDVLGRESIVTWSLTGIEPGKGMP